MRPQFDQSRNVRAWCDRCASVTTFEQGEGGSLFGAHGPLATEGGWRMYRLYRCSGCRRGGVGELAGAHKAEAGLELVQFWPASFSRLSLPPRVPEGIRNEVGEAATCADAGAFRGGSALLRSALEKTLMANGYKVGNLKARIDEAANDGIITSARRQRAHTNVRDLGNDVVHEEWRPVDAAEFESAYLYTTRLIEDFYEHREEVEAELTKVNRVFDPA